MKHPLLLLLILAVTGCRMETKEPIIEWGMSSKPGAFQRPAQAQYDTAYAGSREAFLDSLKGYTMPENARQWWANHSAARKERRADLRSASTRAASAADSATAVIHEAESRRLAPNIWARRDEARRRFKEADEWLKAHGYDEGGKPNHSEAPKTPAAKRTMTWYACEGDTAYLHDIPAGIDSLVVKFVPCGDDQEQPLAAAKVAAVMAANDITPLDVVTWLAARGQTVDTESAWWHPHWRAASGTVDYYVFEMKGAVRDTAAAIRVRDAIGAVEMRVRGADVLPDGTVVVGPWSPAGRSAGELLPGVVE